MTELPLATDTTGMSDEIISNVAKKKRQPSMKPDPIKLSDKKKPIMTADTELQVEAAMAQYNDRKLWKEWGMDYLRQQGGSILLHGKPGTGKSTIAEYMAAKVSRGITRLNMKDVGGKAPGHTERAIAQLFGEAKTTNKTIYIDECEAILWDRSKAGSDSMWMVGVIDELLMQISAYKGLVILATNHFEILDTALVSRCLAVVEIKEPEFPERVRLWMQKMPERFPVKLTRVQIETIATTPLTGRQIENAIVMCASLAIVEKQLPTFEGLCNAAKLQASRKDLA